MYLLCVYISDFRSCYLIPGSIVFWLYEIVVGVALFGQSPDLNLCQGRMCMWVIFFGCCVNKAVLNIIPIPAEKTYVWNNHACIWAYFSCIRHLITFSPMAPISLHHHLHLFKVCSSTQDWAHLNMLNLFASSVFLRVMMFRCSIHILIVFSHKHLRLQ